VIGANTERSAEVLRRIYLPLTDGSYYDQPDALSGACSAQHPAKLLVTSAQSSEIIKHASNAFLALKISFINAVANLAEAVDADIEDIAAGIGLDSRIGPKFLKAGLGYGGSCFPRTSPLFIGWRSSRAWTSNSSRKSAKSTKPRRMSSSTRCAPPCGPCAASASPPWDWPSRATPTTFASLPHWTSSACCWKPAHP